MHTSVNCARFLAMSLNPRLLFRRRSYGDDDDDDDDDVVDGLFGMVQFVHMVGMYREVHYTMHRVRLRVASIVPGAVVEKYPMVHYRIGRRWLNYPRS